MTNADLSGIGHVVESMTPEERDRTLTDLLRQQRTNSGDDARKIEDANLLLRLRPKVRVVTYIPLTRRYAERLQDRKVWDLGIVDPLADEDIPGRPQIVRVETVPEGEVLFARETVLGLPGTAEPVRVAVPSEAERRWVRPSSADLDEGSRPSPQVVAGVQLPQPTGDDFEDRPGDDGPRTIPVDPQVLQEMVDRLERLEAENERLRQPKDEPEPTGPAAKAADKRRGRDVREPAPGAKDAQAAEAEPDKAPVGS